MSRNAPNSQLSTPLQELTLQWLQDCHFRGLSTRTIAEYAATTRKFGWWLANETDLLPTLAVLTPPIVKRYAAYLATNHPTGRFALDRHACRRPAPGRAQIEVRILKVFAKWLAAEEFTETSPLRRLALPKHRFTARIPLTQPEQDRLLAGARRSGLPVRDVAVVSLLLTSGARTGELCSLTVGDGLNSDCAGTCRGKTGSRPLYWSAETARYIQRYLRSRPGAQQGDPLFVSRSGAPLTPEAVHGVVAKAARCAGVGRPICPHILRHSFATRVVRSLDLVSAQRLCGHKTLSMTARYCTPTPVELRAAHDAVFGPGRPR